MSAPTNLLAPRRWTITPRLVSLLLGLSAACTEPVAQGEAVLEVARSDETSSGNAVFGTDEWSQWRGPDRAAQLSAELPTSAPESLELAWRVAVGGGYASPVVSDGRVFVHDRIAARSTDARDDDATGNLTTGGGTTETVPTERLRAFSLADGTELWASEPLPAPFAQNEYATSQGAGPFSTPVVDAGHGVIYSLGVNAVLEGRDVVSGALRCRLQPPQPDTSKLFTGTAMSPLVLDDGAVVVHLGDDRGGRVVAFDCDSERELWAWEGDGPGYASPTLFEAHGVQQIVTLTDRSLVGIEAASGELLWRVDFSDEWNENIVTPSLFEGTVLVSAVRRGAVAVRPQLGDGSWSAPIVWERPQRTHYMSSPVVLPWSDSTAWLGLSNKRKGQLVALDPRTGADLWEGEGRFAESASLVASGRDVLALTTTGELVALRPTTPTESAESAESAEPRSGGALLEAARYPVADEAVWSHLALAGDLLVVRSAGNLRAWRWPDRAAGAGATL